MKLVFVLDFFFWLIGLSSLDTHFQAQELDPTFWENSECVPALLSDIQGSSEYVFCAGDEVLLEVFSNSVDSPVFTWYADQELTVIISQGPELVLDNSLSLEKVFVSVEGKNTCRSDVGEAKQVDVRFHSISEPLLPRGLSYFSPQGFGVEIVAEYPDPAQSDIFEFHWFDDVGSLIEVSSVFTVDKELPRGFYQYSVASKNSLTGCISNRLEFTVVVDDTEIPLDNCTEAGSYTISSNICPSCTVDLPDNAVDYNMETYSELRAVKNTFNGGYIGQNLIFPIVGNKGDSVSVSLSFPGWNEQLDKLSSISLSLYNGTRKVSSEYFLNTDAVHVKRAGEVYKFTIPADLQDNSESYVSVLVKSYTALPDFFANVRVHMAEMIFAIPTYPLDPFTTCEGTSTRISAIPGENTFLRWYSTERGGVELSSGNGYTTPKLSVPGEYTYWVSVFRSNCESYARYPVRVTVTARPTLSDIEVEGGGEYCYGDVVVLKPGIQKDSQFSQEEIKFLWYHDALGVNKVTSTEKIELTPEGNLILQDYMPGEYSFFLSAGTDASCMLLPPDFKKVEFNIREEIQPPVFSNSEIELCSELTPTLEILKATENVQVKWYQDQTLQSPLPLTTLLKDGVTYYAVTVNQYNCESIQSAPVTVSLISCAPVLSITKSYIDSTSFTVISGEELSYSIVIRNDGLFTAYDLLLDDPLPAGTSYVSSTPEGELGSGKVSWSLDSLRGGESRVFELRLLVSPSLEEGTVLRNTAYLTGPDGELEDESEPVTVLRESSLRVEKELLSSGSVYPGDTVRYRISVDNSGPSDASLLRLVDDLPDELEYVGSEGGAYQSATHEVIWELERLGVGARASFELVTRVSLSREPGLIRNSVIVLDRNDEEEDTDTNEEVEVVPLVPELFLEKSLQGPAEVLAGGELVYRLLVENRGRGIAYNLLLEDPLPEGTSYVSSTPEGELGSGKVSWSLDSLRGGESRVFELRLLVSPSLEEGTVLRNTAYLTGPDGELEDESEPVTVLRESSLRVEKELLSSASVYPGDTVRYRISVDNSGPSDASLLRLVDDLPDELEYVGSEGGAYQSATHEVIWELERLGVGARASFELVTRVSLSREPGLIRNSVAVLNRNGEEEDTDTNEEVEIIDKEKIELQISKSIIGSPVRIGGKFRFGIQLKNAGTLSLNDLVLTDTLQPYLDFLSSDLLPTANEEGVLTWEIDELEAGESIKWEFEVQLAYQTNLIGGEVTNKIWAIAEGQPDRWFAEVTEEIFGASLSELQVNKSLIGNVFNVGDVVEYGISILNQGEHPIWNVKMKDYFPTGLQFVGFDGAGFLELYDIDSLEITIPVLEVGQELGFTLSFLLVEFSQGMVNVVTVSADNAPDVTDASEILELREVDVAVLKEVSASLVEVGREFGYKITVSNISEVEASAIEVIDVLPVQLDYVRSIYSTGLASYNSSERLLTWKIEKLLPGEAVELTVIVLATTEGTSIANSASVSSHEQDSDYSNNESTVIHVQFSIHFPNVFTPNGDGINDTWEITGINLFPTNSLVIVNRWGVEVFGTDNYKNEWTGGNLVEGTYFYSFKWKDDSNQVYEKTGFIHLKK
ncbi:gliding motility-associated C-terminal domain-containing protein [Algoriphagus sp. AGSA1]|uniref:Ig-like domain-containing protein n=1 Tax=Algoriphagus sp. AGSA1 TaxID=2907213 RepID=UPI001F17E2A2|nr:gliding motility-associated C-terminal domain-containing protein [Algoriphagus sp. AGSA1]MCE7053731.1 gliding motility-associated C-terminal domain-containing protein [Algoriphagus sp. AGSA1]